MQFNYYYQNSYSSGFGRHQPFLGEIYISLDPKCSIRMLVPLCLSSVGCESRQCAVAFSLKKLQTKNQLYESSESKSK